MTNNASARPAPPRPASLSSIRSSLQKPTKQQIANECTTGDKLATNEGISFEKAYEHILELRAFRDGKFVHLNHPPERYERPFEFKMSGKGWAELVRAMDSPEFETAYPRVSYNAAISTLIIQCMPNPVHESVINVLRSEIGAAEKSLPLDDRVRFSVATGEDRRGFRDDWEGSKKIPDLGIAMRNAGGGGKLKWVLEVGFSEDYRRLKQDVDLWLLGHGVEMVTTVKFTEVPAYRRPIDVQTEVSLERLGIPSRESEIRGEDMKLQPPFGPVTFAGHTWAGRISSATMTHWVVVDGEVVEHGESIDLVLNTTPIRMPFTFLSPLPPITIDARVFSSFLSFAVKESAVLRCQDWLCEYFKWH